MGLRCCQWFCLIKSALGVLCGFSAFVTFFFFYSNYEAGIWAFSTGVIASICLHIHYLEARSQLSSWHSKETLTGIQHLGVVVTVLGAAFFHWYLFYAIYHHTGILPVDTSSDIKAIWAYLTGVYGCILYMTCKKFSENVDSAPLLLDA